MKFSVKQLKAENQRLDEALRKTKLMLDERVERNVFNKAIERKLNKEDIFSILQEFAAKDERIKAMHETLQEVTKRLDYISDKIDRRILKLKKELDLTSIQKLLKSKADDNEVKKEFESIDFRVKNVDDTLGGVKKDLDGMFASLKKITDVITMLQQDQATAIGSTRNALCLSCGRGDATFLPPMKHTKGADGNFYQTHQTPKVNGKGITNKEDIDFGYEVFDKQEVTREHIKMSHEPVDNWIDRPGTMGNNKALQNHSGLRNSRKMPPITKT